MLKFWGDFASLLEMRPSEFTRDNTFGKISQELDFEYFVREARLIRYLTPESMDIIYESVRGKTTAGKLTQEYNETKQGMFDDLELVTGQLFDELVYVQGRNIRFGEKLDTLIQQETMSKVVKDILEVV